MEFIKNVKNATSHWLTYKKDINYQERSMGIDRLYIEFEKWNEYRSNQNISILMDDKFYFLYLNVYDLAITTPTVAKVRKGVSLKEESVKEFKQITKPFKHSVEAINKKQIINDIAQSIVLNSKAYKESGIDGSENFINQFSEQIENEKEFLDGIDEILIKQQKRNLLKEVSSIEGSQKQKEKTKKLGEKTQKI